MFRNTVYRGHAFVAVACQNIDPASCAALCSDSVRFSMGGFGVRTSGPAAYHDIYDDSPGRPPTQRRLPHGRAGRGGVRRTAIYIMVSRVGCMRRLDGPGGSGAAPSGSGARGSDLHVGA